MNALSKVLLKLTFAVLLVQLNLSAQIPDTPLEKFSYLRVTTHDELLSYIQLLEELTSHFKVEYIGESVQGRKIPLIHVMQEDFADKIKVLIFCQQHGNEPSGKEAALLLLKKLAIPENKKMFSNIDLYIIPSVNPDGNESGKRFNANGKDLNRNHLLLDQPEVIALHELYNRLQPEVTLDVHEYSAFRKEFKNVGYFRTADEQFGAPTNLNVSDKLIDYALNHLFPYLESNLTKKGIIFSNYYKMNGPKDTVRTSTTGINDGRQSFAILNTFSLILEGKNGRNMNDELNRRANSQLAAIESFLSFVNMNSEEIKKIVSNEKMKIGSSKDPIAVQMDYVYDGSKINLPVKTNSGKDTIVTMNFSPKIKLFESVERPEAYIIPAERKDLIDWLDRQGISYQINSKTEQLEVEIYKVKNVECKWMENKSSIYVYADKKISKITLKPGDIIVPLNDFNALKIAIAFEPASMWGLVQYDEFSYLRNTGSDYPILRIPIQNKR
jgi:hypothetical protein